MSDGGRAREEPRRGRHVVVFAGGDPPPAAVVAGLPDDVAVVAADSGAVHALAAHRSVDVLVGDLDSVPADARAAVEASGGEIHPFPAAKDATDLALAFDAARDLGARRLTMVGGHGGRLDHFLANILLLTSDDYADLHVEALVGGARVVVARDRRTIEGRAGELVSLLPVGGTARGVTTEGLLFPLSDAVLRPGTTWGVSNQLLGARGAVTVTDGVLLVVLPGELGSIEASEVRPSRAEEAPPGGEDAGGGDGG